MECHSRGRYSERSAYSTKVGATLPAAERESLSVWSCLWSKFAGIRPSDAAQH